MTGTATLASVLGLDPARLAGLVAGLRRRNWTVATAESLTAGLVCAALTEVPGSSAVLRGGLVVYSTDLKHTLAGVPDDLLARTGPVHPRVAAALAAGARHRCGSVLGLGLTGVAGPDPQDGRPVGTVHLACAGPDTVTSMSLQLDPASSRAMVRAAAVRGALDLLVSLLDSAGPVDAAGSLDPIDPAHPADSARPAGFGDGQVSPTADTGIEPPIGSPE